MAMKTASNSPPLTLSSKGWPTLPRSTSWAEPPILLSMAVTVHPALRRRVGRLESASPDPAKRRSTLRACSVEEGCVGDGGWVGLVSSEGGAALATPPRSQARAASAGGGRGPRGAGTPFSSKRRWGISSIRGATRAGTATGGSSHRCETASWGAGWLAGS